MQNWKTIFSYQKFVQLGGSTLIYCSLIIVVHVHVKKFTKVHPAHHNIANEIKLGSYSKRTDKHAVECSKDVP